MNSVLKVYYSKNVVKIMNMYLLFEFENYQAETSAKLSCIETQKRLIQQCKKTGLLLQPFLSLLHQNQFTTDKS